MARHRARPSRAPLSRELLLRLAPIVEREVRRYVGQCFEVLGSESRADVAAVGRSALQHAFAALFGDECTIEERRTFLAFAAPIVRRVVIDCIAAHGVAIPYGLNKPLLLEHWLYRLETFDPHCVLMVDLHYFCGLSVRQTAASLGCSVGVVLRDLRFARRWLQAYAALWDRRVQ